MLYKPTIFLYFPRMKRYIQHEPFNIYQFESAQWEHPVHKHSYYEIIFIRRGSGEHSLNGNTFPYETGDVFLLGPEDYHFFRIREQTSFCYLRFTEHFVRDQTAHKSYRWVRMLDYLLSTSSQISGSIVTQPAEQELLGHLLAVLIHEYENQQEPVAYEMILNGIMKAILGILSRNVMHEGAPTRKEGKNSPLLAKLVAHIHQHIYQPEQLRLEGLGAHFNFSPNYLSALFKKETGESLQQYILQYKLKMIRNRLQFSDRSLAEIADEFGFADASHFNKFFKKHGGVAPSRFKSSKTL